MSKLPSKPTLSTPSLQQEPKLPRCRIHGKDCPGDDGGFFIDGNHPDDMFSLGPVTHKTAPQRRRRLRDD